MGYQKTQMYVGMASACLPVCNVPILGAGRHSSDGRLNRGSSCCLRRQPLSEEGAGIASNHNIGYCCFIIFCTEGAP